MKKFFGLFAIILLSSLAASAQTAAKESFTNSDNSKVASKKTSIKNDPRVLRVGPSTTYLRNGLTTTDVKHALGRPASVTETQNGNVQLATYTFRRSEGRILIAEFENNVLVRSRIETPEAVAQNK